MIISVIISIDKDVVQIYNDKYVKLLSKNLVDKSLKACKCVCSPKNHYLVPEMAILSPERGLPLVPFADFYLIVCTGKVELGKLLNLS